MLGFNNEIKYYLDFRIGEIQNIVQVSSRDFNNVISSIGQDYVIRINDDVGTWFNVKEYSIINDDGLKQNIGAIVSPF